MIFFVRLFISKIEVSDIKIRKSLPLLLLSFCGVFPIMISQKQSFFYILTVYPLFSIGLAAIMEPLFLKMTMYIYTKKYIFNTILVIFGFLVIGVTLKIHKNLGIITKDVAMLHDVLEIRNIVPENTRIGIPSDQYNQWSLHGYFARYAGISLDPDIEKNHIYFLLKAGSVLEKKSKVNRYDSLETSLKSYKLYKLRGE